jgi:hypothetical protein
MRKPSRDLSAVHKEPDAGLVDPQNKGKKLDSAASRDVDYAR